MFHLLEIFKRSFNNDPIFKKKFFLLLSLMDMAMSTVWAKYLNNENLLIKQAQKGSWNKRAHSLRRRQKALAVHVSVVSRGNVHTGRWLSLCVFSGSCAKASRPWCQRSVGVSRRFWDIEHHSLDFPPSIPLLQLNGKYTEVVFTLSKLTDN